MMESVASRNANKNRMSFSLGNVFLREKPLEAKAINIDSFESIATALI